MRLAAGLVLRFGAAFLIIGSIFYFFDIAPRQTLNTTIANHVNDAKNFNSALKIAQERLKTLSDPSTIAPAQKSGRAYANKVNEAKGAFSINGLKIPKQISNHTGKNEIKQFNAIVSDPGYRKAVQDGSNSLKNSQAFLSYHAAVMLALANLLEYNPAEDLSSSNEETLEQRLSAAQSGLQTTIDRINAVPKYENDQSLNEAVESVAKVQAARDRLAKSVGSASFSNEKQTFIDIVRQAQMQIIANRSTFWSSESQKLLKATTETQKSFERYLTRLQNI